MASTARASPPADDDLAFNDVREHSRPDVAERLRASLLAADATLNDLIRHVGMVHALLDVIAHDAVVNVPGQNIAQGRKAAEAALRAAIPTPADATFDRSTYTGNVSHDGFLGYTFGRGTAQLRQPDGSMLARYTLYITAWRREGVHWRVEATLWNFGSLQPSRSATGPRALRAGRPRNAALGTSALERRLRSPGGPELRGFVRRPGLHGGVRRLRGDGWDERRRPGLLGRGRGGRHRVGRVDARGDPLLDPTISGSTFSGDLAWSTGNSEYVLRNPDGSIAIDSFSKYITLWARQPDGSWKFLLDGGNARPAPAP